MPRTMVVYLFGISNTVMSRNVFQQACLPSGCSLVSVSHNKYLNVDSGLNFVYFVANPATPGTNIISSNFRLQRTYRGSNALEDLIHLFSEVSTLKEVKQGGIHWKTQGNNRKIYVFYSQPHVLQVSFCTKTFLICNFVNDCIIVDNFGTIFRYVCRYEGQ